MPGVYSAAAAAASTMLRRLGLPRLLLDAPVAGARGDAKIGGGAGDLRVTTTAVDDRHQRRPALVLGLRGALPDATTREQLYGARIIRTWAVHTNKEAPPGHVSVNGKVDPSLVKKIEDVASKELLIEIMERLAQEQKSEIMSPHPLGVALTCFLAISFAGSYLAGHWVGFYQATVEEYQLSVQQKASMRALN